ncbi:MAG: anhydro-N-acetylmuramic acid kinase [Castellaniella sp.]
MIQPMDGYYIGLMSGTSTDGIDGVLAQISSSPDPAQNSVTGMQILASASLPLPETLRDNLLALNTTGHDELARAAQAANTLADCYASIVVTLLQDTGLPAAAIHAIGAHGQTVRHAPESGYTVQINAPARLVERTGIAVVADFRSRDVAAGGQGAPLVPAFHAAQFGNKPGRVILNLGGIANLTVLSAPVRGFDTGPANMLMDAWARQHLGVLFDKDGAWAASGQCNPQLLTSLMAEPWLDLPPPKSTGRDLFNLAWLRTHLQASPQAITDKDVQATLLQFSVETIRQAIEQYAPDTQEVLVCGGGALNTHLMHTLAQALPCSLETTQALGVPVQSVEALAFAWLAHAHLCGYAACLPAVTGAPKATIAGCLYPV